MPQIKAIIYDMDGLLLDTESIIDEIMEHFAGRPVPPNLRRRTLGRKPIDTARLFVSNMNLDITAEEYLEQRQPLLEDKLAKAKLMPGAQQITSHFTERRIPQAVATSTSQELFALKTASHKEFFSQFACITTGDQVKQGKPHPELFLTVAKCLGSKPANCLVFEDAPSGIAAAKAANMPVVAIPHPLLNHNDTKAADQALTSLENFNPTDWGLPAYA